ncbi:MAG: hypothetical protein M1816_006909 [Peltula sp. TS41687]|nr:MAG: hypothetical protein M1816_006909 [Peltula sp. TS41687]
MHFPILFVLSAFTRLVLGGALACKPLSVHLDHKNVTKLEARLSLSCLNATRVWVAATAWIQDGDQREVGQRMHLEHEGEEGFRMAFPEANIRFPPDMLTALPQNGSFCMEWSVRNFGETVLSSNYGKECPSSYAGKAFGPTGVGRPG